MSSVNVCIAEHEYSRLYVFALFYMFLSINKTPAYLLDDLLLEINAHLSWCRKQIERGKVQKCLIKVCLTQTTQIELIY